MSTRERHRLERATRAATLLATMQCKHHGDQPITDCPSACLAGVLDEYLAGTWPPPVCPNCTKRVKMPKEVEAGIICPHCDSRVYAPGKEPDKG